MSAHDKKNQGIDIAVALEILGQRSKEHEEHKQHSDGCACGPHNHGAQSTGQVIDLYGSGSAEETNSTEANTAQSTIGTSSNQEAQQDGLLKEIDNMSTEQRIQLVLQAQQDRVTTYRQYDK